MINRRWGRVVNVSSIAGFMSGSPPQVLYSASGNPCDGIFGPAEVAAIDRPSGVDNPWPALKFPSMSIWPCLLPQTLVSVRHLTGWAHVWISLL